MTTPGLPVHLYDTHGEAEQAIRSLNDAGFNMKSLSLVGKGCHTEEQAMGFYTSGDRIKSWGGRGAFWGGLWGLLFSPDRPRMTPWICGAAARPDDSVGRGHRPRRCSSPSLARGHAPCLLRN